MCVGRAVTKTQDPKSTCGCVKQWRIAVAQEIKMNPLFSFLSGSIRHPMSTLGLVYLTCPTFVLMNLPSGKRPVFELQLESQYIVSYAFGTCICEFEHRKRF